MSILEVRNLSVFLGRRKIIEDLSFSVNGSLMMLLGRNGCGKSTLIKAILGLIPSKGNIIVDGSDITNMSVRKKARLLSYLPQHLTVPAGITVSDYVAMGAFAEGNLFLSSDSDAKSRTAVELKRIGIDHLAERYVSQLSGGESQLAALARARVQQSKLMLMDEPLSGLDFVRQHEFMALARKDSAPILMSLHDPIIASRYADTFLIMDDGKITVCDGNNRELFENTLTKLYGNRIRFEQCGADRLPVWCED